MFIIVFFCKGKGVALEEGNYQGLKLLNRVIKIILGGTKHLLWQRMHMTSSLASCLEATPPTLYSLYANVRKFPCIWLCRFGKGIRSCTHHLVVPLQAWCCRVAGVAHTKHVWKYRKQNACCLQSERSIQCESGYSARLLPESLTVHHSSWSPLWRVWYRMSLGKPACRCPGHHLWIVGGMIWETNPLENCYMEVKWLWFSWAKQRS